MNEMKPIQDDFFRYQARRFQELMEEVVQCCEARTAYFSEKFGIPAAELRCLLLFREEKYLTVKGIAQKLDVAKSRVTKIVSGLLDKGLVTRIDDPSDGRVKLISLTRKGRAKSEEITSFTAQMHAMVLLEMEPEERKMVLTSLERLRTSMEAVKDRML